MTGVVTEVSTRARRTPAWVQPAVVATGALAACAYVSVVDPNHSSAYPQCPWKALTGLDCPMCGATRAVHSLLRGNVVGAMDHNLLFVLTLPFVLYGFVAWTATCLGRPMRPVPIQSRRVWIPFLVLMVVFTVLRNLPIAPFHWLNSATA